MFVRHFEEAQRVQIIDVLALVLRQVERIDGVGNRPQELRPAFRIERAIGAEQHMIGTEEFDAAACPGLGAVDGGIAEEHPEVIDRPAALLPHLGDDLFVLRFRILPGAELIEAESIFEWRLTPRRLDDELGAFLDRVWGVNGANPGALEDLASRV